MSKKVYIGIGHGGTDPGAAASGLKEKDLALSMGFLVQEALRGDVETKMSRTSDATFPTASKISDANAWGADVVIDLHFNSGGGVGFEVFHSPTADGSVTLAQAINDAITATGRKSRGIKPDTDSYLGQLGIIRRTNAPAVLLEYGFLDSAADVKLVADPAQQRAWAEATAAGVLAYLGIAYTSPEQVTQPA